MRSLSIPAADVRNFMNRLLKENLFNFYCVRSIEITQSTHIIISGKLEADETGKSYATWGQLSPLVHYLIKDGGIPKILKIIFSHPAPEEIHPNAAALFLNFVYEKEGAVFTTATAQREFVLDKILDKTWDDWVQGFIYPGGTE